MSTAGRYDLVKKLYKSGPTYEAYVNADLRLEPVEETFFQAYCPNKESRLCDIGCGNGREAIALYSAGYHNVWPVDLTATMLAAAKRNATERQISLPFTQASAEALPFTDRFFDAVIISCNVYGHITPRASRLQSLREMARVLKPGGLVFLTATSRYHTAKIRLIMRLLDLSRLVHNPRQLEPGDRLMSSWHNPSEGVGARPVIHWFYPEEIPGEAREVGLTTVCSTTVADFIRDPRSNAASYQGKGWFAYVLSRPQDR